MADSAVVEIIINARSNVGASVKKAGDALKDLQSQMKGLDVWSTRVGGKKYTEQVLPGFTSTVRRMGEAYANVNNMQQLQLTGWDRLMSNASGVRQEYARQVQSARALERAIWNMQEREREAIADAEFLARATTALERSFYVAGAAAVKYAMSITMTAARTEELGLITARMAKVHGYSESALNSYEEQVKSLGITTQGARLILTQFMGSQINLVKSSKLARAAQNLATLGMVDSSEAAADLAFAVASLQPRLLRKYRIYISLVDVYRLAAKELGKTVVALTDAERQQAFLNAILQEAAQYTGLYEEKMRTAAGQMRSLERHSQELANELGEGLVPVLQGSVVVLTDLAQALHDLPDPAQTNLSKIIAAAGVTALLTGGAKLLGVTLKKTLVLGLVAVGIELLGLSGNAQKTAETIKQLHEEAANTSKTYVEYVSRTKKLIAETVRASDVSEGLKDKMVEIAEATILTQKEYEQARRVYQAVNKDLLEQDKAVTDLAESWSQATKGVEYYVTQSASLLETYHSSLQSLAQFLTNSAIAEEDHANNVLTIRRRRAALEAQLAEKGYSEQLDGQLEAIAQEEHQAEAAAERMKRQQRSQLGAMLAQAAQAAGLSVQYQFDILERFGTVTSDAMTEAESIISTIDDVSKGVLTEAEGLDLLSGVEIEAKVNVQLEGLEEQATKAAAVIGLYSDAHLEAIRRFKEEGEMVAGFMRDILGSVIPIPGTGAGAASEADRLKAAAKIFREEGKMTPGFIRDTAGTMIPLPAAGVIPAPIQLPASTTPTQQELLGQEHILAINRWYQEGLMTPGFMHDASGSVVPIGAADLIENTKALQALTRVLSGKQTPNEMRFEGVGH